MYLRSLRLRGCRGRKGWETEGKGKEKGEEEKSKGKRRKEGEGHRPNILA